MKDDDILKLALEAVTKELDRFIGCCVDSSGSPVSPKRGDLMKAKACLPRGYANAFSEKVRGKS
jgi:hypothetical protein